MKFTCDNMNHRMSNLNSRRLTATGDRGLTTAHRRLLAPGYSFCHSCCCRILLVVLIASLAGCAAKSAAPSNAALDPERQQHARSAVERGPVRATAEIRPPVARLSDEPTLTLSIESPEGVKIERPEFGATLGAGAFTIRDIRQPLPKIRDGRQTVEQILTLEPTRAGRLKIDPIRVAFTDGRPKGDGRRHELETEPLSIEITSALGERTPSLADLRPPAGPFDLADGAHLGRWLFVAAIVAAAAIGWWLRHRRHREIAVAEKVLSHEELANAELDRLVESGLAERDVKQFYVELTGIVRRYIEFATGVRAPEQTTEEFLREISRANTFGRDACAKLRDFLEAADLVKFAALRPGSDASAESVRRARTFIGLRSLPAIVNESEKQHGEERPATQKKR
jgi:hypothetical protein